jgi:hypothetical protein
MKKLRYTILAAAVLTLPLSAQITKSVQADIPFEFVAGHVAQPAGTYVLTSQAGANVVRIQLVGTGGSFLTTNPERGNLDAQAPKLVFHRYGSQYFLSQIGSTWTSRDVPQSAREREAMKTTTALGRRMETVIVVAAIPARDAPARIAR